ncbi:ABC transporter ATP-binding protein [Halegenticoccus tardaugens]|uniref:ABC transporter ATP-binding protein n=1 Tax=Halegenticoccus tardaugens TaxID=2071624 RepID=UPI00100A48D4|nr:sn-glycerol-3-phosphate ABC transporter ATP-binding protein UgpC [Halegenticoccus tardaugens]
MGELDIDDLTKAFPTADGGNRIVAVDGLDISVADGEFLVLLGPSGCGKSTTLRCVAGLERPTDGHVRLDSEDITDDSPQQRDMAMVFQDFALYPHMSAAENMGFGLKMTTDLSGDEIENRVGEAASIMDIGDLLDKKPRQLSGGQKQRVALGRAIVRDPEVFLMDEPLSNLDAKLRTQMRTEIQRLHRRLDVTTLYVTHDQTEAMTMSDRIVILDGGELQQIGTPSTVYHHPVNRFVAGFIGSPSMNFLDVELIDEQRRRLTADGETRFDYPLPAAVAQRCDVSPGDELTLGVRPEAIRVVDHETDGIDQAAEGRDRAQHAVLDVVEPMGSDDFLYLLVGDSAWTARVDSAVELEEGQRIALEFDADALHIFDAEGRTLKSAGTGEDAYHESGATTAPTPGGAVEGIEP